MKFPIFTCLSLMMVGFLFILYIVFNYGFHNPTSGAFTRLDEHRDDMMGPVFSDWARELLDYNHSWWGTSFCILIVVTIVCAFIDVLRKPTDSLE